MRKLDIFNELSEFVAIRILSCHEIDHDHLWEENKIHKNYDLWLIASGKVVIETGDQTYNAYAGDVVFYYPDSPYRASTSDEGCRFIYIQFDFGIGNNARVLDDFYLDGILRGEVIREEVHALTKAFGDYKSKGRMSSIRFKGCFTVLLAKIIDIMDISSIENKPAVSLFNNARKTNISMLNKLQPIFKYILENMHKSIRIAELSSIAGMSEKYFITYFKRALGLSPNRYIYQLRMNRARDFIYERKYCVKEIAHLLGYPDPYTFSKAFKKYFTISPSKFE
jgi:AraC family transcriptional regulator